MKFESLEPNGSFFVPIKNALSLFNGISALHLALDRAGIEINTCYYAEIDKYANKITEHHYPGDIALGDVTKWREWDIDWASIDLVGAGFPCQAWSVAGKQLGDKDERGMLFWTTLEIIANVLKHNPKAKFLMENVKMKKDFEQYITYHTEQALGHVEKILINSALVSAQNRNRYYWTNFEVTQPDDKGILLGDIIEQDSTPIYKELESDIRSGKVKSEQFLNGESQTMRRALANGKSPDQKANTLTSCAYKGMGTNGMTNVIVAGGAIRGRYIVDGKRQDHKMKTAGLTEQRLEVRNDGKTNTLTTVQKDNVVCFVNDNKRVKVITEDERGYRPHRGDTKATGISELGRIIKPTGKTDTITSAHAPKLALNSDINHLQYRKLTPLECERLQTFNDGWTDCISNTQRYKSLGNAWTVDVIAHILQCGFKS